MNVCNNDDTVIVIRMGCPETTFIIFGFRIHSETII